jgi:tetratricopeptide (TPR) repeat protein
METEQNREAALSKLLAELFDGDGAGLLRWVRLHLGKRIHDELPTGTALSQLAFYAMLAIQRHGLARQAFASLSDERPRQAERIQEVARLWPDLLPHYQTPEVSVDSVVPRPVHGYLPEPAPLPAGSRMHLAINPLFVGRVDELRNVAEALQVGDDTSVTQVTAVTGLGGIGKTQLAAAFVHCYGQFFKGGVFWLSFADPASVPAEVALCGGPEHLGLWAAKAASDIDTQVAMVRKAWAEPIPRLLVFDNCEDEALLTRWRPSSGGCRVLVTCRRRVFSPHLGVHALELDVLPRAESLALLHSFVRGGQSAYPMDDTTLDAICAELGDLPLALHLAGSFLARYRAAVTPAGYLAQLHARSWLEHPSLQGRGADGSPTDHELHVGRTLALSWDRLDPADAVDASAGFLMRVAACLAPSEPIPRMLLVAALGMPTNDPDAALVCEDALRRLLDLGLLGVSGPDEYRIHRLVMAFVQQSDGDHAAARAAIEQALLDEARRVNQSGFPARLLPWQSHLREITDAAHVREDERAASLCSELASHLRRFGDYRGAHTYCERALAIRERLLGPDHPDTATSLNDLGIVLRARGAYAEARLLFDRALAIRENRLGSKHPHTARSLNELAWLLYEQRAHAEALPLCARALAIRQEALGSDHLETAESLNNLALLLYAQGAYAQAQPLCEQALALRERHLGPEHPETAESLNNLAMLLYAQAAFSKARPLYERALAIIEKQLGPEHPETGLGLNNLAALLQTQGAYEEARVLFERALAIYEKQLEPGHPYITVCMHNFALLLQAQGAYKEARSLYERVLAIYEDRLGPSHPDTQLVRDDLKHLPMS